jgi:hypothetical protein
MGYPTYRIRVKNWYGTYYGQHWDQPCLPSHICFCYLQLTSSRLNKGPVEQLNITRAPAVRAMDLPMNGRDGLTDGLGLLTHRTNLSRTGNAYYHQDHISKITSWPRSHSAPSVSGFFLGGTSSHLGRVVCETIGSTWGKATIMNVLSR